MTTKTGSTELRDLPDGPPLPLALAGARRWRANWCPELGARTVCSCFRSDLGSLEMFDSMQAPQLPVPQAPSSSCRPCTTFGPPPPRVHVSGTRHSTARRQRGEPRVANRLVFHGTGLLWYFRQARLPEIHSCGRRTGDWLYDVI